MPKKTDTLSNYIVTVPDKEINPAIKLFIDNLKEEFQNNANNNKIGLSVDEEIEKDINGMNEFFSLQNWVTQNLSDDMFEEPYMIKCSKYFEEINPFQKPFKIFCKIGSVQSFGWVHTVLKLIFDEKDIEMIQKAVNEDELLLWKDTDLYLFGPYLWKLSESEKTLAPSALKLLILESLDKERKKFERLKKKYSGVAGQKLESRREVISEDVKIFVWRRDEGKCVKCQSQENLEFDHIIPVSKGGSSTARNIQILCEKCNREKSNNI